jgi:hypothetical protein
MRIHIPFKNSIAILVDRYKSRTGKSIARINFIKCCSFKTDRKCHMQYIFDSIIGSDYRRGDRLWENDSDSTVFV